MKLIPKITAKHLALLRYSPLQDLLKALEAHPKAGMVYENETACIVRTGPLLFFGGQISDEVLRYLKEKILTFELYEKYGTFYFIYPDRVWQEKLHSVYPEKITREERSLYRAAPRETRTAEPPKEAVPVAWMFPSEENFSMVTDTATVLKGFGSFLDGSTGYTRCTLREASERGMTVYWEIRKEDTASVNAALSCGFEHVADFPVLLLDLREMDRSERAPGENTVRRILSRYFPSTGAAKRVPQGASTYVYKAEASGKTYYARFLPENSSFGAEVLAHKAALEKGVSVPRVAVFEDREPVTGLSLMVAEEIAGSSIGGCPPENPKAVLYEAGRQLALLHTIPVEGFGWIDRSSAAELKGEKATFREYFTEYLEDDLAAMEYYDFTPGELESLHRYMEQAFRMLDTDQAVLVHGDMDISHIFHLNGAFTGFIDFGEIRGCHPYFDLATFSLFCGGEDYLSLLEGYRTRRPLHDGDLKAVERMALFIALRFAGKKVETNARGYWYEVLKKQLEKVHNAGDS